MGEQYYGIYFSAVQWAAVRIHWSLIKVPPQNRKLMKEILISMNACQGHRPGALSVPPTIRELLLLMAGFPQF